MLLGIVIPASRQPVLVVDDDSLSRQRCGMKFVEPAIMEFVEAKVLPSE